MFRFLIFYGALTTFVFSGSAHALSNTEFLRSEAISAFKAKDFATALPKLEQLLDASPGDPLILRYIGITLDRLGRYQEAIDAFKQVLARTPVSAAAHYHLGVTYYKSRQAGLANEHFNHAVNLGIGTRYAELGVLYLNQIAEQRLKLEPAGAPERWGFYASVGIWRDDNVPAAPDAAMPATGKEGTRGTAFAAVKYIVNQTQNWINSIHVSRYASRYTDAEFDAFEVDQSQVRLQAQRNISIKQFKGLLKLAGHYTKVRLGGEEYSSAVGANTELRINFSRNTATGVILEVEDKDFERDGFSPATSSRDALRTRLSIHHRWYGWNRKAQFGIVASRLDDDADGLNFERKGHEIAGYGRILLSDKWRLRLTASVVDEEYPDFVGPVRRETERLSASASLTRRWNRNFLSTLSVRVTDVDSTIDSLSYDRTAWGFSTSYVY